MKISFDNLFRDIPPSLRNELKDKFIEIVKNYNERRWESSELNGGKFCEVIYTILDGFVKQKYAQNASKPQNMEQSCKNLANYPVADSVRLSIPRAIVALYEVRNRRGVGHVSGDVNPNHMDAVYVLNSSKWILAELIRVFNGLSVSEARIAVEELSSYDIPLVCNLGNVRRVLNCDLNKKEQTLVLLHSSPLNLMSEKELTECVEYSNLSMYRKKILIPSHKKRLLEYDQNSKTVQLLPPGIAAAEEIIRKHSNLLE